METKISRKEDRNLQPSAISETNEILYSFYGFTWIIKRLNVWIFGVLLDFRLVNNFVKSCKIFGNLELWKFRTSVFWKFESWNLNISRFWETNHSIKLWNSFETLSLSNSDILEFYLETPSLWDFFLNNFDLSK